MESRSKNLVQRLVKCGSLLQVLLRIQHFRRCEMGIDPGQPQRGQVLQGIQKRRQIRDIYTLAAHAGINLQMDRHAPHGHSPALCCFGQPIKMRPIPDRWSQMCFHQRLGFSAKQPAHY